MNDSFESDERKRKETIECLYWSLMNGWNIPKDIREHYGFSEDYELYHRLESMEPEDYRERRLRGCLLYTSPTVREGKLVFVWQNNFCRTKTQLALFV